MFIYLWKNSKNRNKKNLHNLCRFVYPLFFLLSFTNFFSVALQPFFFGISFHFSLFFAPIKLHLFVRAPSTLKVEKKKQTTPWLPSAQRSECRFLSSIYVTYKFMYKNAHPHNKLPSSMLPNSEIRSVFWSLRTTILHHLTPCSILWHPKLPKLHNPFLHWKIAVIPPSPTLNPSRFTSSSRSHFPLEFYAPKFLFVPLSTQCYKRSIM